MIAAPRARRGGPRGAGEGVDLDELVSRLRARSAAGRAARKRAASRSAPRSGSASRSARSATGSRSSGSTASPTRRAERGGCHQGVQSRDPDLARPGDGDRYGAARVGPARDQRHARRVAPRPARPRLRRFGLAPRRSSISTAPTRGSGGRSTPAACHGSERVEPGARRRDARAWRSESKASRQPLVEIGCALGADPLRGAGPAGRVRHRRRPDGRALSGRRASRSSCSSTSWSSCCSAGRSCAAGSSGPLHRLVAAVRGIGGPEAVASVAVEGVRPRSRRSRAPSTTMQVALAARGRSPREGGRELRSGNRQPAAGARGPRSRRAARDGRAASRPGSPTRSAIRWARCSRSSISPGADPGSAKQAAACSRGRPSRASACVVILRQLLDFSRPPRIEPGRARARGRRRGASSSSSATRSGAIRRIELELEVDARCRPGARRTSGSSRRSLLNLAAQRGRGGARAGRAGAIR